MDVAAATVSDKMFWIDKDSALKQDASAFQNILMEEAAEKAKTITSVNAQPEEAERRAKDNGDLAPLSETMEMEEESPALPDSAKPEAIKGEKREQPDGHIVPAPIAPQSVENLNMVAPTSIKRSFAINEGQPVTINEGLAASALKTYSQPNNSTENPEDQTVLFPKSLIDSPKKENPTLRPIPKTVITPSLVGEREPSGKLEPIQSPLSLENPTGNFSTLSNYAQTKSPEVVLTATNDSATGDRRNVVTKGEDDKGKNTPLNTPMSGTEPNDSNGEKAAPSDSKTPMTKGGGTVTNHAPLNPQVPETAANGSNTEKTTPLNSSITPEQAARHQVAEESKFDLSEFQINGKNPMTKGGGTVTNHAPLNPQVPETAANGSNTEKTTPLNSSIPPEQTVRHQVAEENKFDPSNNRVNRNELPVKPNSSSEENGFDTKKFLSYENEAKKESASTGTQNIPEAQNQGHQKGSLNGNFSGTRNTNNNTPSPVLAGENKQMAAPTEIQKTDIPESVEVPLWKTQRPIQGGNALTNKKSEKAEEAKEKSGLFSSTEEEAHENEHKTPTVSQSSDVLKEDISKQKPRHQNMALGKGFNLAHENGAETPLAAGQDEGLSTEELNDQKRFQNMVSGDKRDPEAAQAARKETVGYLYRKIESFIKTGKNDFSIKLYPEALGSLQIKVHSQGDILKIHMTAQSQLSKNVIESTLSELKTSLAEQGFQTDQLSVTVGRDGSPSNSGNSNFKNDNSNNPGNSLRSPSENNAKGEDHTTTEKRNTIVPSLSNVNIFA